MSPGARPVQRLKEYLLHGGPAQGEWLPLPAFREAWWCRHLLAEEKKPKDCRYLLHPPPWGWGAGEDVCGQGVLQPTGVDTEFRARQAGLSTPHPTPHPVASCRICCRCGAEYPRVFLWRCVREEECYYH